MKKRAPNKSPDPVRGRTDVPGQNPRADDSPDHDEHHDESRHNVYEPEAPQSLKGPGKTNKGK